MKIYIGMEQAKSMVFLNKLMHEVLGCASTIILMIFFCNARKYLPAVGRISPETYSILYNRVKICEIN
jgi:hypothetical protein